MIKSLNPLSKILDAIKYIELEKKTIAPIVKGKKLIGTISDGDIRRGILRGKSIDDTIEEIFNSNPVYAEDSASEEEIAVLLNKFSVEAIPIINSKKDFILFLKNKK